MRIRSAFILQFIGAIIPPIAMFLSVPLVRKQLEIDSFAGFTLILSAIGFFSAMDGGLGRVATYFMSLVWLDRTTKRIGNVVVGIGLIGFAYSALLMAVVAILIHINVDGSFHHAKSAFFVLALFIPFFIASTILRGILEAQQRFIQSTSIQVGHGIIIGFAPLIIFFFDTSLVVYAWFVGVARIILVVFMVRFMAPGLGPVKYWKITATDKDKVRLMLNYSKWLFLSNVVGLAILFTDRLVIGTYFPSTIVAAYILPMELIARSQILVSALCSAIFPKFVQMTKELSDEDNTKKLIDIQGMLISVNIGIGFIGIVVAHKVMSWWLGDELGPIAAQVVLIGIIGLALISSSAIAMLGINSIGNTRSVAYLHAVELALYIGLFYITKDYLSLSIIQGIWLIRLFVDAVGMNIIYKRHSRIITLNNRPFFNRMKFKWSMLFLLIISQLLLTINENDFNNAAKVVFSAFGLLFSGILFKGFSREYKLFTF